MSSGLPYPIRSRRDLADALHILLGGEIELLLEVADDPDELLDLLAVRAGDGWEAVYPDGEGSNGLVRLADVEPVTVRWLWPGRIPLGRLTILDGDPGLGKSTVALDLAARVSRGAAMPDGRPGLGHPAGVVLLSAEDGLADTVRPRLDAAGADPERIVALRWVGDRDPDDGTPTRRLPTVQDLPELEVAIRETGAALLVVDPLSAYLGPDVNAHRDADVRAGLAGLAELAERTGVAVLAIRHLTKARGGNPLYAGQGSIGLVAAARSALLLARDPDDPTEARLILASVKNNLAPRPPSLSLQVVPVGESGTGIEWKGESGHAARDLLQWGDEEERTAMDDAKAFLLEELREGPVPAKELQAQARDAGHHVRTLRRAADALGVQKRKPDFRGGWEWSLPGEGTDVPFGPGRGQETPGQKGSHEGDNPPVPFGEPQAGQGPPSPSGVEGDTCPDHGVRMPVAPSLATCTTPGCGAGVGRPGVLCGTCQRRRWEAENDGGQGD